jgi:cytochrome c-type biogenesis protein CcmI
MELLLAIAIVAALAVFVAWPLWRRAAAEGDGVAESPELADLEARKEALYRQIRDAELDREQGKLSRADWGRLDAELRREAIAVLKRIDALSGKRSLD